MLQWKNPRLVSLFTVLVLVAVFLGNWGWGATNWGWE